ncbi:GntR family transcriptional regulator [Agromyces agglutinans]|uniref:GntR family transcriptional regulator n=1 Tax=Agromyces agglutinans TaxID=2662258 RepID=UPI001C129BCE|nr:GntR family transcriptional regulator [Agromyces agglutinans]
MTISDSLRELVVTGALDGADRLSESAIAARLGVSRTPVREALQRLESEGLVFAQGRGVRIRRRSPAELRDVYEARAALDGFAAARLAERQRAGRLAPATLAELDELAEQTDAATRSGDLAVATARNRRFHERIAELAGNPVITLALRRYWDQIQVSTRAELAAPARVRAVQDEHAGLLAAIRSGEPERAATLAQAHALATAAITTTTAPEEHA